MPAPRRKERTFRLPDDFSLSNFTNEELRSRYRFGRESIKFFIWAPSRRSRKTNHALSTTVHVLVALRFFASGSFLQVIGDTLGLSKSSVSLIISQVSLALAQKQRNFIKWPSTEEILQNKSGFFYQGAVSWGDWLCWRHSHQDSGTTWKRKRFCQS